MDAPLSQERAETSSFRNPIPAMTEIDLITDTLEFYGEDTDRRAVAPDGACQYLTIDGRHCGIGRLVSPEVAGTLPNNTLVQYDDVFLKLPDELQIMGRKFLRSVQAIHDEPFNWKYHASMGAFVLDALKRIQSPLPDEMSFFIGPFMEP